MPKILITNAEYNNTLSVIRSLKKEGFEVIASGWYKYAPSFFSRYVKKSYIYTSPLVSQEKFISDLIDIIKKERPDVLLPVGNESTVTVSKYKKELEKYVKVPIADYESLVIAHDKLKAAELAESVGVPIPKTFSASNLKDVGFPVIVKARMGTGIFSKANNKEELIKKIKDIENNKSNAGVTEYSNPVVQEFITGQIHDACLLYNKGELRAALTQKRVRTIPIDGGPGIYNQTTYEPMLIEYSDRMLKKINYHGPALVEFIVEHKTNIPKMIEINTKIWGTSALSIKAGINFSLLSCLMAINGDIDTVMDYRVGIKYKWPVPHLIEYLKQSKHKFNDGLDMINIFGRNTYSNISLSDPVPDIMLILRMIVEGFSPKYLKKVKEKNLQ